MKLFVITPYFETKPAWVQQAHDSVRAQTIPAHHVLVCDGSDPAPVEGFQGTHILLQRNYRDYGNTPRLIGCYQALAQDADAIAFLDADNWYQPQHLEKLVNFARANNLDGCSSARMLHRLDGSLLSRCHTVNGRPLIDTNCLLIMKPVFQHLLSWALVPQETAAVADQVIWQHMRAMGARLGFLDEPTVAYRTRHTAHYQNAKETPPPEAVNRTDYHGDRYH